MLLAACRPRPATEFPLRFAVWGPLVPVEGSGGHNNWTSIAEGLLFQGLIDMDADGGIVPVLATQAQIVSRNSLKVWLRADTRLSDGSPLTFEDVAASLAEKRLRATRDGDAILIQSDEPTVPVELAVSRCNIHRRT